MSVARWTVYAARHTIAAVKPSSRSPASPTARMPMPISQVRPIMLPTFTPIARRTSAAARGVLERGLEDALHDPDAGADGVAEHGQLEQHDERRGEHDQHHVEVAHRRQRVGDAGWRSETWIRACGDRPPYLSGARTRARGRSRGA